MEVGMGIMGWGRGNPYGQPLSISLLLFDPSRWANKSAAAFNLCVSVSVCVCVTAVVLLSGKRMCEHCVGTSGYIMKLTHSHTHTHRSAREEPSTHTRAHKLKWFVLFWCCSCSWWWNPNSGTKKDLVLKRVLISQ